jgi:hypothetical protein
VPKTKNRQASGWFSPPPQKLELNVNMAGPAIHIPRTANNAWDSLLCRSGDDHESARKTTMVIAGRRSVRPITTYPEKRYAMIQWTTTLGVQNTSAPSRAYANALVARLSAACMAIFILNEKKLFE